MSEPTFTPGPWEAVPRVMGSQVWLVEGPSLPIDWKDLRDPADARADGFREADARLIAAAPDLYDVVKRLGEWDMLNTSGIATVADGPYWKRELARALAKARGEAS